jgi:general secretion pathway protein G
MQAKRGFTLVEILIVVVILGILAAIVIPQFTQASSEAKLNSLCSDLQTMRSQIELYKVQHNDVPPTVADIARQLMYVTNAAGAIKATDPKVRETGATATYIYGPYLERIPDNPFNGLNTINTVAITTTPTTAGGNNFGWQYNPTTGEIYADDSGTTPEGVIHSTL